MTVTVLSILGWCRNGSTILGNILNEVDQIFHVGELHFLWKNAYGNGSNQRCGCGRALLECGIWRGVLDRITPAGRDPCSLAQEIVARQRQCVRTRHTWRVMSSPAGSRSLREHAELMARTYRAIADLTSARTIIDTNKIPGESAMLPAIDGIVPRYLHLVRDPRAVAHSWSMQKDYAYRMHAAKSTAYWVGFNAASAAIVRRHPRASMVLRYEDFIADPKTAIDRILSLCEVDAARNPLDGRSLELRPNHTVTGNPDRFRSGRTEIRDRDDRWRDELSHSTKMLTEAIAWPLMRAYGYTNGPRPRS